MTKVQGLDQLERQLLALPQAYLEEVRPELGDWGSELLAHIQASAPKHTGEMARNITLEQVSDGKGAGGVAARSGLALRISCPAPGRWVEFGTKAHGPGDYQDDKGHLRHAGRGHHATRRYPFFWPSIHAWNRLLQGRFYRAATKAAKRIAAIR